MKPADIAFMARDFAECFVWAPIRLVRYARKVAETAVAEVQLDERIDRHDSEFDRAAADAVAVTRDQLAVPTCDDIDDLVAKLYEHMNAETEGRGGAS